MTSGAAPYRFESGDGYGLIVFLPALNDAPWSDIERIGGEILHQIESSSCRGLLVDLTPLNYMGSAMMALIVRLWKSVKQQNKSMVVVNHDPMVFELLRIARLDTIWTIVATREEGFRQLGVAGRRGAAAETRKGTAWLAVGMAAVVGAVAALGLLLANASVVPAQVAFGVAIGCAAAGLIAGTVITVRDQDTGRRILGVVMVVAGLAALLAAFLNMPRAG